MNPKGPKKSRVLGVGGGHLCLEVTPSDVGSGSPVDLRLLHLKVFLANFAVQGLGFRGLGFRGLYRL